MATAAPPPQAITRELFKQHGVACRVYDYEEEYESINSAALSKSKAIKDELKDRGFKDFSSFYMSCPKFSLLCWPSQLGDLGGGVVLYFHFLAFCGGFLLLAFFVQLPAMIEYIQADSITSWNWDSAGFLTKDTENCECIGKNNGFTGPAFASLQQQDYGTSCQAWDLSLCMQGAFGPYAQDRGLWCCRSWCYASDSCPNTQAESPSLSNRYLATKGLVRSYSACTQPDVSLCSARPGMNVDKAYPYDAYRQDDVVPKTFMRITGPGNLGPDNGESSFILMSYFILLALFCMGVVVAHQYQLNRLAVVDQGTTQPNDFAIFVEGLPGTATDEAQIAEFFRQHAVLGRNDTEIAKVVIGWESKEYRDNMRAMKKLQAKLVVSSVLSNVRCLGPCVSLLGRCVSIEPVETLMKKLTEIQERIRSSAPDMAKRLTSSGVVIVVFRFQSDQRKCLRRWAGLPARLHYTDANGCLGLAKGDPLPRFFHRAIRVKRAPNPSDINWEDLGVQRIERWKMLAKTNGIVILLIAVCFFAVYGLEKLKDATEGRGFHWSVLPVLGISITNTVLMAACKFLGKEEFHNTLAEQTASQSLKVAVALVMNTAGVIFFKNAQPKDWYVTLVDDVTVLLVFTGCIQPLMFLMDFKYYTIGHWKRRNLTDAKLDEWNSIVTSQEKPKTKQEAVAMARQRAQVAQQVERMKKAFQPSELDTTKRYAVAVRTFLCCLLFSPLMPLLTLVGMVGLGVQYWVDKYMLLRWFKRPTEPHPGEQAVLSMVFMRYATAIFLPIAAMIFLLPSWKEGSQVVFWFLMSLGLALVFCITPLSVSRTLLCVRCIPFMRRGAFKVGEEDDDNQDYYKAQRLWTKEMKYHKSQFLYKMVPESKNPEMLVPGAYAATTADDLRGSYGVAAASMASGAQAPAAAVHVRGHGHMDMGSGLATTASGDVPGSGGPTGPAAVQPSDPSAPADDAAGGAAGGPAAPAAGAAAAGAGDEPPSSSSMHLRDVSEVSADVGDPPAPGGRSDPAPAVAEVKPPVWNFETGKGFSAFGDDCQSYIEKKYQEKLAGGSNRINVQTNGITISLDFERMTQKAGRNGKIRKIRRDAP